MPDLKRPASTARRGASGATAARAQLSTPARSRPRRSHVRTTGSSFRAVLPADQRWMVAAYGD